MKLTMICPQCHAKLNAGSETTCGCGASVSLNRTDAVGGEGPPDVCPVCAGEEFFIRKDFPQKLGLIIMILTGLMALGAAYFVHDLYFFAVLFAVAAIDMLIYFVIPRLTVCYRCRCEFRGGRVNPDHGGFDLATSEKYVQD